MKTIEMMEPYWDFLKRLFAYAQYCVDHDIGTLSCREFWNWTIFASIGLVMLIVALIAKTLLKEQIEFYRNKKRLEARKIVADPETIEEARWKGEDASDVDISQQELAAKMRQALGARRGATAEAVKG